MNDNIPRNRSSSALSLEAAAILPRGFRAAGTAAGLKASGAPDMAMLFSDRPATVVGTFTTNQVRSAHVRLDEERVRTLGLAHGVVVNSVLWDIS